MSSRFGLGHSKKYATLTSLAAELATENPAATQAQPNIKSQSSSSIKNYEVSKRVSTTTNPTGTIKRIVAAILIRDKLVINELGEQVLQKISDEEKANLEALVRDAIGFRENRGDSITISSGEFVEDIFHIKRNGSKINNDQKHY